MFISNRARCILSSPNEVFIPFLSFTHPPANWVLTAISPEVKREWGVKLTDHFHLVPRSGMSGAVTLVPHTPARTGVHRDYFTFSYRLFLFFTHVLFFYRHSHFCSSAQGYTRDFRAMLKIPRPNPTPRTAKRLPSIFSCSTGHWFDKENVHSSSKVKFDPRTGDEGQVEELKYSSTLSLTSALDGVGGQCHAADSLPPGKTRYQMYRRMGGPQGRTERMRKISPPPRFDSRTIQPVACRYTG